MIKWILTKIVGSKNERTVKRLTPIVDRINEFEQKLQSEPVEALKERTAEWQARFRAFHEPDFIAGRRLQLAETAELKDVGRAVGQRLAELKVHFPQLDADSLSESAVASASDDELRTRIDVAREEWDKLAPQFSPKEQAILEEILPEAFAVVKNGARRLCGTESMVCDQPLGWEMIHFDVQLIGGICLHRGNIAEMATGEGKTLVATLPVYLNALTGRGVHVITVNDYLARRDAEWMGALYQFLGLTIGCIQNDQDPVTRRLQYLADITYGTNSEFGFDYLRDNGMASSKDAQVQRGHYFSIIDEVDSVLIDEARTPLIISGPVAVSTHQYDRFKPLVQQLVKKQSNLVDQLVKDATQEFADGKVEEGGRTLLKVKMGEPRNEGLMRAMEEAEYRKAIEGAELALYNDPQKKALYEIKEELYFTLDEKTNDADLSEMGRLFLNPDDPDAFTLLDLAEAYSEIDGLAGETEADRLAKKQALQESLDVQAERIHNISQLLKAFCLYERDKEYVVSADEQGNQRVVIVDENTGREMPGRRWSDGLHQAVEAKEGVKIDRETQTLATITIQNYFRLYEKLAGMTGTAETDAAEFHDIYGLDVLPIPTNRPIARIDNNDSIYKTQREKFNAVVALIKEKQDSGQPTLVGTASVEASEHLSRLLKQAKIQHSVLNAKFHRQEAEIVAAAGQPGAVTVSTNMAGRGTDIKLGAGVAESGGLFVLGTERHEGRRIDRQLRGRCARQGDPGESRFFISFEDSLMRNFGAADRMTSMMERLGLEEGQELEHPWLNKSVETAQKRVEQRNYTWRKRVLEFDDVMNQQREVVYGYRNEIINSIDPHALVMEAMEEAIPLKVTEYLGEDAQPEDETADYQELYEWVSGTFPLGLSEEEAAFITRSTDENIEFLLGLVRETYEMKNSHEDPEHLEHLERHIILEAVDRLWQEHLYAMDSLKEGVGLRQYGQKDPLVEYKVEAFALFGTLMNTIKTEVLRNLFRTTTSLEQFEQFLAQMKIKESGPADAGPGGMPAGLGMGGEPEPEAEPEPAKPQITLPIRRETPKAGRNDPCPCGSGKKFKACHGLQQG